MKTPANVAPAVTPKAVVTPSVSGANPTGPTEVKMPTLAQNVMAGAPKPVENAAQITPGSRSTGSNSNFRLPRFLTSSSNIAKSSATSASNAEIESAIKETKGKERELSRESSSFSGLISERGLRWGGFFGLFLIPVVLYLYYSQSAVTNVMNWVNGNGNNDNNNNYGPPNAQVPIDMGGNQGYGTQNNANNWLNPNANANGNYINGWGTGSWGKPYHGACTQQQCAPGCHQDSVTCECLCGIGTQDSSKFIEQSVMGQQPWTLDPAGILVDDGQQDRSGNAMGMGINFGMTPIVGQPEIHPHINNMGIQRSRLFGGIVEFFLVPFFCILALIGFCFCCRLVKGPEERRRRKCRD